MRAAPNWLYVAEDCVALARIAKTEMNRAMLLASAARWRRMARIAQELDGAEGPNQTLFAKEAGARTKNDPQPDCRPIQGSLSR
jgi:hypothetical protein